MDVVTTNKSHRWPNGHVPFEIDGDAFPAGSAMRAAIQAGIDEWNNKTPLRILPRNPDTDADYIFFREFSLGGQSPIGRQGGRQVVEVDIGGSNQRLIPDQKSKASPALAALPNRLHMVHLGDSSNDIWHSSFDGMNWSESTPVLHQKSKAPPALAVFDGRLHMVHLGDSSNDIWHSTYDGGSWTENVPVRNQKSKVSPALAVLQNRLHMVHLGDESNQLWHSIYDERWRPNVEIEGQLSKAAVALAGLGSQLHVAHLGNTSNAIWHSQHMQ
jgi:hypothetical protein